MLASVVRQQEDPSTNGLLHDFFEKLGPWRICGTESFVCPFVGDG